MAAIVLTLIMVVIAMIIARKNQALLGFTMNTQAETLQTEGAGWAIAQLRGDLQGNGVPATLGLPASLGPTQAINGQTPGGDTGITGDLTYLALSAVSTGPDGYTFPSSITGAPTINIPNGHAAAVFTTNVTGEPAKQKYLSLFSGHYPFGLMATGGTLDVKSVHSTTSYENNLASLTGLMNNIYAHGAVAVGTLNGRAFSKTSTITVASGIGGILHPKCADTIALPADFVAKFTAYETVAASPAGYSTSLRDLLNSLHTALTRNFASFVPAAILAEQLYDPAGILTIPGDPLGGASPAQATLDAGGTDYNGTTLKVVGSLHIPAGENQLVPCTTATISGDLWLEDNATLYLQGANLAVAGTIRLGKQATLVVDGTTSAAGLAPSYQLTDSPTQGVCGICSTFLSRGGVTLSGGMSRSDASFVGQAPSTTSQPFPLTLTAQFSEPPPVFTVTAGGPNALAADFLATQATDIANTAALVNYLGSVIPTTVPADTLKVPGVFLCSDNAITVAGGGLVSGLLYANGVSLSGGHMIGAVWSRGSISMRDTDYRYFPYFTHCYARRPGATDVLSAIEQHPTAYGKLP